MIIGCIKEMDKDAQYDTSAKRLLGQKSILAHILVKTVDGFTAEQIASATDKDIEEVKAIIAEKEPALA